MITSILAQDFSVRSRGRMAGALSLVCALAMMSGAVFASTSGDIANSYPPASKGYVTAVTVDASGNRYVTGTFSTESEDFDPGVGVDFRFNSISLSEEVFVTRYNANGTYAWTQTFGGQGQDVSTRITVANNVVYVVGTFDSQNAGIYGFGTVNAVSSSNDAFVFALNAIDGTPMSGFGNNGVVTFGGSGFDSAEGVAVSGSTVYVVGGFNGTDAGFNGAGAISSLGQTDAFVIALNAGTGAPVAGFGNGGFKQFGGTSDDTAFAVAIGGSVLFVSGNFVSNDAGIGATGGLATSGGNDAFVICLSATDGSAVTTFNSTGMVKFGGSLNETATGITLDASNVYVTGYFNSINAGINGTGGFSRIGNRSAYVMALTAGTGTAVGTFGTGGLQKFGGSTSDEGVDITNNGSTLFVTGNLFSKNAGIGGPGMAFSQGGGDIVVFALNTSNGQAASFGTNGIQVYGGSLDETAKGIALTSGGTLLVAGYGDSIDAGLSGLGRQRHDVFHGILLPLNASNGAAAFTQITSPLVVGGYHVGFNYTIVSSPAGTSFSAQGLPAGLSLNAATGQIFRNTSPIKPIGTFLIPISATSAAGTTTAQLQITIVDDQIGTTFPPTMRGPINGVATEGAGNMYVCGAFSGTFDFNPKLGVDVKTCQGTKNAFITRVTLGTSTSYGWTQTFGGNGTEEAKGIAIFGTTVYVVGTMSSTNAGFSGTGTYRALGASTAFVLALNKDTGVPVPGFGINGVVLLGGTESDEGLAIAASLGNVYVTGSFNSPIVGVFGTPTVNNVGGRDVFVLKLSATNGAAVVDFGTNGIQTFGGTGDEIGRAIAVSGSVVYVTGDFNSTDAGISGSGSFGALGGKDCFVLALNGTGNGVAAFGTGGIQRIGGSSDDIGNGICVGPGTNLYVTGSFGSSDIGVGALGALAPIGGTDAFVAALQTSDGNALVSFGTSGVQCFGSSSTTTNTDGGLAIASDANTVYATGFFSGVDAGLGIANTLSAGGFGLESDAFVLGLDPATGLGRLGFGVSGIVSFGGSGADKGRALAVSGTRLYLGGELGSSDAGFGGVSGPISNHNSFNGMLLPLNTTDGSSAIPIVTSPLVVTAVDGQPFFYFTNSTPAGSVFSGDFPAGLTIDGQTGTVSGTLDASGFSGDFDMRIQIGGLGLITTEFYVHMIVVRDLVANTNPPVVQGGPTAMALDGTGNRFVCGSFFNSTDFNPGVGLDAKLTRGGYDCYVTRFNADGSYSWTQTFGGSAFDFAYGIVESGGKIYVVGSFDSTDAGFFGMSGISSSGSSDIFILALDALTGLPVPGFGNGGVVTFGGAQSDFGSSISISGGVLYVGGGIDSFDAGFNGTGSVMKTGDFQAGLILALSASNGAPVAGFGNGGAVVFGGLTLEEVYAVTATADAVYVVGSMTSATGVRIGGMGPTYGAIGTSDSFLIKLNLTTGAGVAGFGNGGLVQYGVFNEYRAGYAVTVSGGTVYVGGDKALSRNASRDSFVAAYREDTGAVVGSFGSSGIQTFGGSGFDYTTAVVVSGARLLVAGAFSSTNAKVGIGGSTYTANGFDGYVVALNAASGQTDTTFGNQGIVVVSGSDYDYVNCLAAFGSSLYIAGDFYSTNAKINGAGIFDSTGFNGYLAQIDATTGGVTPAITSNLTASGVTGTPFNYPITATNSPTGFGATGLPSGLTRSGNVISGNLPAVGSYSITLSASNTYGSGPGAVLMLTVNPPAPAITSTLALTIPVNAFFSYSISATNSPTTFSTGTLPPGLALVPPSNLIQGTPTTIGQYTIPITAANVTGSDTKNLVLTVVPPAPVITSLLTATGTVGVPFTYSIVATNTPTIYAALGLPSTLSFNNATGAISGTPAVAEVVTVSIGASNLGGGTSRQLVITINPPPPVITSLLTAVATVGVPFTYTVTATNSPTNFGAAVLPPNFTFDSNTGVLTGTPSAVEVRTITISATNAGGTDSKPLLLSINPPKPVITSSLTATATVGVPFTYTVTATNSPTGFTAVVLPPNFTFNATTGVLSGTPGAPEVRTLTITASNAGGTDSKSLVLTIVPAATTPVPVIDSALTATGTVGVPFSYTITATNSPLNFSAFVLPPNLALDSNTGVISGTPTVAEVRAMTITATNAGGTDTKTLILTINPAVPPPVITSPLIATGSLNAEFTYFIAATNSPTGFDSSTLPRGLRLDKVTGVISGKPTELGTFTATISATNAGGTDTKVLVFGIFDGAVPQQLVSVDLISSDPIFFTNQDVTFTLTGLALIDVPLTYSIDFGDGTEVKMGSTTRNTPIDFDHAYKAAGTYTVEAKVSDGVIVAFIKMPQYILSPNSGAEGVPNISDGKPPVENPLNGLSISVLSSDGGVVQLAIDIEALLRESFTASTDWGDIPGRSTTVLGLRPVHQFIKHGIFVAKTSAIRMSDNTVVGKGRKMITVSSQETGETTPKKFPVIQDTRTRAAISDSISVTSMKGKFIFNGVKSDTVAFKATITLPAGIDPGVPHEFSMGIGNIIVNATVDGKGKGTSTDTPKIFQKLKLTYVKLKKGQISKGGEICKVEATLLSNGLVAAGFDTEGISKESTDVTPGSKTAAGRSIQVAMLLDGVPYEGSAGVDFTVSKDSEFGSITSRSTGK